MAYCTFKLPMGTVSHSLNNTPLQLVYHAIVVARLTYAAIAWRGLPKAFDCQRIKLLYYHAWRLGYSSPALSMFDELCDTADNKLFNNIVRQSHALLPPPSSSSQRYNLRHRAYSLPLPEHSALLSDSNFLICMLYKNTYFPIYFLAFLSCLSFSMLACILSCRNKRILLDWLY